METVSETKKETQKPLEVLRTKSVTAAIESAPIMMGELTHDFILKKGINERAKIRLQMKAILDLISVDTELPSANKEEKKATEAEAYAPRRYTGEGRMVDAPDSRQNENILGGTYG